MVGLGLLFLFGTTAEKLFSHSPVPVFNKRTLADAHRLKPMVRIAGQLFYRWKFRMILRIISSVKSRAIISIYNANRSIIKGESEPFLGCALAEGYRDKVNIATV